MWDVLSDERMDLYYSYNFFWALPEQSFSGSGPTELVIIFYCLICDSPNLEGQIPVLMTPRFRVAQLYLRALGFLFVACYESQGYGDLCSTVYVSTIVSLYFLSTQCKDGTFKN
jgi:hypothetical protein